MFTFKVVDSYELLEESFRFRYRVVREDNISCIMFDNNDQFEIDEYDKYSIHMVALDTKGKICATTRLILNSPIGFPTPNNMICNIKEDPKLNFAELSRVFVSKEVRGLKSSKTILYNLSCLSFYFIKKHNIDYIYAGLEKEFLKLLKLIKINFRVIGKPVEYYGNRYPCISSSRDFIGFDMDLITKY